MQQIDGIDLKEVGRKAQDLVLEKKKEELAEKIKTLVLDVEKKTEKVDMQKRELEKAEAQAKEATAKLEKVLAGDWKALGGKDSN